MKHEPAEDVEVDDGGVSALRCSDRGGAGPRNSDESESQIAAAKLSRDHQGQPRC